MPDSVVHFEIPADNLERAHNFYREAFGWNIMHMPELEYTMVGTTESDEQGAPIKPGSINGGMGNRQGALENPCITIGVDDIDKTLEKVTSLGGTSLGDKVAVADMGWAAYFKDSEGNVMGIWQSA